MYTQTNSWNVTIFDEKNEGIDLEDFELLIQEAKDKHLLVMRIQDKSSTCSSFVIQFN